jgi:hypothetical protein
MERIFLSHASKDKEIIQGFMDEILIGALSIKLGDIFCTTTDGTKIKSGEDWRNEIRAHLVEAKITFLFITPNYKESEICLNEMGAAWVLGYYRVQRYHYLSNLLIMALSVYYRKLNKWKDSKMKEA